MLMTVMNVGVVPMGMPKPRMSVPVGMRFAWRITWRVVVLVVIVVIVEMFVLQRLVDVLMFMAFGNVQPDTY